MTEPQVYPGARPHDAVYPAGDPAFTAPQPPSDDVPDFAPTRPRPTFMVGGEVFQGKVEIAALPMMRYAIRASKMDTEEGLTEEAMETTLSMIRLMLTKESAERLIARMDDDDNPVGMDAFNKLVPWLMEQYGMRPTEPLSDSADGSPTTVSTSNSTGNSQPTG